MLTRVHASVPVVLTVHVSPLTQVAVKQSKSGTTHANAVVIVVVVTLVDYPLHNNNYYSVRACNTHFIVSGSKGNSPFGGLSSLKCVPLNPVIFFLYTLLLGALKPKGVFPLSRTCTRIRTHHTRTRTTCTRTRTRTTRMYTYRHATRHTHTYAHAHAHLWYAFEYTRTFCSQNLLPTNAVHPRSSKANQYFDRNAWSTTHVQNRECTSAQCRVPWYDLFCFCALFILVPLCELSDPFF